MVSLSDFSNEVHIRMYVLDVLKDYIKDPDFDDLADKAVEFILDGSNIPKVPIRDTSSSDIAKNIMALFTGFNVDACISRNPLEQAYARLRKRYVFDPRDRDKHGVIVGYSNDFNSLVAVCDESSKKGIARGSSDFVDVNEKYVTNGFFYISVEEADKQSDCAH